MTCCPHQERAALTHHGLAPQAAPVLQAQHAAAGLVTHRALGTYGQVPFQPLVRHGDLQTKQRHALGHVAVPHARGTEDLGLKMLQNDLNQDTPQHWQRWDRAVLPTILPQAQHDHRAGQSSEAQRPPQTPPQERSRNN